MEKLATYVVASAALIATPAFASVKAPPPPPAPVYNWTGWYDGGNVGYSWGNANTDLRGNGEFTTLKPNGVLGGLQAGYNLQSSIWVLGGEADIQATGQRGHGTFLCVDPVTQVCVLVLGFAGASAPGPVTTDITQKLPWFGTVRGRLGATLTPTVLAYVTGGLAYGNVKTDVTVSGSGTSTSYSDSATKAGWTIGGGIEASLGGNWTAKAEYLYLDLGTVSAGPVLTTQTVGINEPVSSSFSSSKFHDNIVRVGLNYQFH
jgi:outer membrane immunogenic protein